MLANSKIAGKSKCAIKELIRFFELLHRFILFANGAFMDRDGEGIGNLAALPTVFSGNRL